MSSLNEQPKIDIVSATPSDLPSVAHLASVIWKAWYPGILTHEQIDYMLARMYDLAVMRQELESGIRYDLILVDGIPAGFAAYGQVAPGELKLHKLYILPERQRLGLGSRLIAHVERQGKQGGWTTLILAVNKHNARAIAAYRKNGFTVRESVVSDIGNGFVMDDFIMAKPL